MKPSPCRSAGIALFLALSPAPAAPLRVLCTTFPIHQITRNIAGATPGVTVDLLLPASLGCPHQYALAPQDMRKLAQADVLVVNGLGLEEFLGAPLRKAHPNLAVIDSSQGIDDLIPYAEHEHGEDGEDDHAAEEGHGPSHPRNANPHLFASPRQAARIARNIAAGLSKASPEHAATFLHNAQAYAERLNALADEMATQVKSLRNQRIVQPHGAFDYLARDLGLEVVAVTQPHGQEPSAAEMLALVQAIRTQQAGAIFTEPQYSPNVARTLARETGLPTAALDPAASGPADAPLDYYETTMRNNLETLRATLGTKP